MRFNINRKTILFFRHAEDIKNLSDKHGGKGTPLSIKGKEQAKTIGQYIKSVYYITLDTLIMGHNVPQVKGTLNLINQILCLKSIITDRLRGLHLGVLAGLSLEEAMIKWPEPASRLKQWRKGKLKIDKLEIPDAEQTDSFYNRIKSTLHDLKRNYTQDIIIVICITSVLIMVTNIIRLAEKFCYEDYKVYEFTVCSLT